MRIGVFGDSFADKHFDDTWWAYLKNYGHEVTSFGESGSSLVFSAGLLWTHAKEFDCLIWCVTNVNRVSFQHNSKTYHVTNSFDTRTTDIAVLKKQKVSQDYLENIHDTHGHEVLAHLAIQGALSAFKNLLIIPCFDTPVYFMQQPGFNLFELSSREAQVYFPGQDLYTIHQNYYDRRSAHLMPITHKHLAQEINTAIGNRMQIFSADYNRFPMPSNPTNSKFIKR